MMCKLFEYLFNYFLIKHTRYSLFFDLFYCRKDANVAGTLSGHASWVLGVAFAPDGQKFASSSADHTVKIWQLGGRQCLHTFNEHSEQV